MCAFDPGTLFVIDTDASEKVILRLGKSSFEDMGKTVIDAEYTVSLLV